MESNMKPDYPGGWILTDDDCKQYVRRISPRTFELIEYAMVNPEVPLYEIYVDTICLDDYEAFEIDEVLRGFGYTDIGDVQEKYATRNEANQVIAECIFEHYGSFSAEQLCAAVPESLAISTIESYITLHRDTPESQSMVEVSMDELIHMMMMMRIGETLDFSESEDADMNSVVRIKHFNAEMLLFHFYGDHDPLAIDLEVEPEKLAAHITERFCAYCKTLDIKRLYCFSKPKRNAAPTAVQQMRDRKRDALLCKNELMERLSDGDYTDRTLTEIRDEYMNTLGFDPVWRYPFCYDGGLGAVLIPVQEGFLWLPYNIIDIEDNEIYEPDAASLLDAESCRYLIDEMRDYMEPFAAVMEYVAEELKEEESK